MYKQSSSRKAKVTANLTRLYQDARPHSIPPNNLGFEDSTRQVERSSCPKNQFTYLCWDFINLKWGPCLFTRRSSRQPVEKATVKIHPLH